MERSYVGEAILSRRATSRSNRSVGSLALILIIWIDLDFRFEVRISETRELSFWKISLHVSHKITCKVIFQKLNYKR